MKSQIKVDYAGLHEGLDNENKKPVIRIELQKSDDPRDTLLNDLVTPTTVFGYRLKSQNDLSQTYILYAKSRHEQVYDIAENALFVLKHLWGNEIPFTLITSHDEIYFECGSGENYQRSKGINRNEASFLQNHEIIKLIVEDFEIFQRQVWPKVVAE